MHVCIRRESRHRKTALREPEEQLHKARGQALMAQYNPAEDGAIARAERSPSRRPSSFASS